MSNVNNTDEKGRGVLKNVVLLYTAIQQPKRKYQSELREYSSTVVMDKSTSVAFSKQFPKKKINSIANDEFVEKFGIDVPFPESPVQYTVKLSQDELKRDGSPIADFARPRVLFEAKDGQIYDITEKKLVGNGSMGDVHYSYYTTSFGKTVRLGNIIVKRLVEYVRPDTDYIDMNAVKELPDDFDISGSVVAQPEGKPTVSVATAPKAEKKAPEVIQDEHLPF